MTGSNSRQERLRSWLLLNYATTFIPDRRREFREVFGSLPAAVSAGEDHWARRGLLRGLEGNAQFAPAFTGGGAGSRGGTQGAWFDRQLAAAARLGASIVTLEDDRYPEALKRLPDPPCALHVKGNASLAAEAIAVVGARRATPYGLNVAEKIGRELALNGVTVVSGGARGIDSAAHRGALSVAGATIAVMGSGLDITYPSENGGLFREIAERGALVSEFSFGTAPAPRYFPFRNRIIAGLGLGVVVVEGEKQSGSLITAALALDAGLEVFAVPGPITEPTSEGPNRLIQDGAKLVSRIEDILEEIPGKSVGQAALPFLQASQTRPGDGDGSDDPDGRGCAGEACESAVATGILAALSASEGRTPDEIAERANLSAGECLGALMDLELRGKVRRVPGGRYARRI